MNLRRYGTRGLALGVIAAVAIPAIGRLSAAAPSAPPTTEANITRLTTNILEHSQFAHHPFDRDLAGALLDRYVDSLDPSRVLLRETDLRDFAPYRATLAQATRDSGDTGPAQAIFARYLERAAERASYVSDLLHKETFTFNGTDRFGTDREHAARPADRAAAEALWRQQLRAEVLGEKLAHKAPDAIARTLTERYAQQLKTLKGLRADDVLDIYLDTLAHVYDPHSDYLGHEQMESFSIAMNLSLVGIGATLENVDGYCKIRELVPGGPAARSGLLQPGDRIVSVTQPGGLAVDVVNMPLSHTVELIRGAKGSTVTLGILPRDAGDGSPARSAVLVRDEIKLAEQEAKARIVDLPRASGGTVRIGVLDLPSFYADMTPEGGATPRSATDDVARLLAKLKAERVEGVVLDLRHNGGGSLAEAIRLTGLFIGHGPVVQTRDQAGDIEVGADEDPGIAYDGPLVVLASRFSASASEILTGALKDYERALIVGDTTTFGKGTVQTIVPLARAMDKAELAHAYDPGALKVTISKFYRPSGASTQLRGVTSDIVLPSTSDFKEVGESALTDPLPWDVVPSAQYEHLGRVAPYLDALRQASHRRVSTEPGFTLLGADLAKLKESVSRKSVSLNEQEREAEVASDKAREAQWKNEALASNGSPKTTYAITLENAATAGLPAPMAAKQPDKHAAGDDTAKGDALEGSSRTSRADEVVLAEAEHIAADYAELVSRRALSAGR